MRRRATFHVGGVIGMGWLHRERSLQEAAFLMPDGTEPNFGSFEDVVRALVYTRERREQETLAPVDVESYARASLAYSMGIPRSDVILAWGDVVFTEARIAPAGVKVMGVVTDEGFVAWWPGRGVNHVFLTTHQLLDRVGAGVDGRVEAVYRDAVYMGVGDADSTGPVHFAVREHVTRDRHANRRAASMVYTLAAQGLPVPEG